ncbi:MAG TPA: MerR family transcriptional regulator [Pyrinomonadaceae bacterium]|nr:MerR family transcriptional regulator [Pyrinomonadaceae bacterium]HZI88073.1 MerR family transcriptional regulator [Pyrinomonadaceae bacterium]
MTHSAVAIPEKLFFKIGEVCELAGVQAHVLRYWESEFPMLAPQKNRAGQRVYRKRDVEMALRIKELLYEDQYTIAGAKKRLANDLRGGKIRSGEKEAGEGYASQSLANEKAMAQRLSKVATSRLGSSDGTRTAEDRGALRRLAAELKELLAMLEKESQASKK